MTKNTLTVVPPDTFDELGLIQVKEEVSAQLRSIKPGERMIWVTDITAQGSTIRRFTKVSADQVVAPCDDQLLTLSCGITNDQDHVYQLCDLPVTTDPLLLFALLSELCPPLRVISSFRGEDRYKVKAQIESSRKRSSRGTTALSSIDSDVTFEEATEVATALSRGSETLVQGSLVILSPNALELDPALFCEEKSQTLRSLAVLSALGLRKRMHRSFIMRLPTASDLVPNVGDPFEPTSPALLQTRRGNPLYLNFQDPEFSAFHMNVNGTTGVGKSVFVAALLNRMSLSNVSLSVLFIDHLRSYRRVVRSKGGLYLEPESARDVEAGLGTLLEPLNQPGCFQGIELSDLPVSEKKAALRTLLLEIERFLKRRPTHHLVYVVLDECWSVLRDEPTLVQRAFREFRKLDGAAVAITQSLSDLIKDDNGQAIFQNSPIQVILRQREDPAKYTGDLGLNSTEIEALRTLRQEKGEYAECLIKTPFFSRIGRLVLTPQEHELYRTDTVRRELVAEQRQEQTRRMDEPPLPSKGA